MTPTDQFLKVEIALNYAGNGYPVFPCKEREKTPLTQHGCLDATTDQAQIQTWWDQWPNANIGIATGAAAGLCVVDLDTHKGADYKDLLSGGVDQTVFNTPRVKTGGGGLQFYYQYPDGANVRNSAGKLGQFIDVRGEGGYVIAPGSVHPSGVTYEFSNDIEALLPFPQEWIDRLNQPAHSATAGPATGNGVYAPPPPSTIVIPDAIGQGTRNFEMTKIAGSLRRIGLERTEVEAALLKINDRVCNPPLGAGEISTIANSVSRYKPHEVINAIADGSTAAAAGGVDYENTLQPYLFGDFLNEIFEPKEILAFHIGKRDIAIIQAATNAGKTTLLRNVCLCMAGGREFQPFYDGGRPIKLAYFDFENDAQDVQRDLKQMLPVFTNSEIESIKKNLIVIPKGLMNGELFQFNTHEVWANSLIQANNVDFIIVDNVSAAYDLNDENSNAEVTKKIIKPLLKMAYKGNCAFLFAHHYGKSKNELESAGVHAGRGASALQSLSRTVINMFGDVSKGDPVTVECAKRKTDGGQNYTQVFRLEEDRWFHHTTIAPAPKRKTAYQVLRDYLQTVIYPKTATTSNLIQMFEPQFEPNSLKKTLNELYKDGFIDRPKHGQYCAKLSDSETEPESGKVRNFYEKDDSEEAE